MFYPVMLKPAPLPILAAFPLMLVLAACVPSVAEPPPAAAPVVAAPIPVNYGGLGSVIGRNAETLERAFGRPDLDVREGNARKLQFSSGLCVLDAYLYPPGGRGEPVVTHVDARRPDGGDFDRASCVAALDQAR